MSRSRVCAAPWESYIWIDPATVAPVAAAESRVPCSVTFAVGVPVVAPTAVASRLPWRLTLLVICPGLPVPKGIWMRLSPGTWKPGPAALGSPTLPKRWTLNPVVGSRRKPLLSTVNEPARV